MGEKKENAKPADAGKVTAVYKIDLHCLGCADKIKRKIKRSHGVEKVMTDCEANELTVIGKIDPAKIKEILEEKRNTKVELVSPQPKKDGSGGGSGGGGGAKKVDEKKPEKKPEEKKGEKNDKKSAAAAAGEKKEGGDKKADKKKPEEKKGEKKDRKREAAAGGEKKEGGSGGWKVGLTVNIPWITFSIQWTDNK